MFLRGERRHTPFGNLQSKTHQKAYPTGAVGARRKAVQVFFQVGILDPVEARLDTEGGVVVVAHAAAVALIFNACPSDFASFSPIRWKPRTLAKAGSSSVTTLWRGNLSATAFA